MKRRGRPPRAIAQVRAVVEFMETPSATKAAAAKKFHTIKRNIEEILTDPRAKSWAGTRPTIRALILDRERCQADGKRKLAVLTRWRNPKLEFIEKVLTPEELERRGREPLDDVYELALGRRESQRRAKRAESQRK